MIPTGFTSNPNWNDQVEQRYFAKQKLDEVAFKHHEVSKTCETLVGAIAACEAAGCTHAEIAIQERIKPPVDPVLSGLRLRRMRPQGLKDHL